MHEIWSLDSQEDIFKFVATGCEMLRLKRTKFNFGWPRLGLPAGKLTPDLLAGFKEPTFQ